MAAKGTWIEEIDKRTRNGKKRVDSADPRHFAVDVTIGSIHYKDNPKDEAEQWKGIDNSFEPTIAPWNWQMLKAGYHIRVKEDFTAGQIIEFEKQGEIVQFQPMALEWTNDLDQIQQISMPQSVTPVITNPEIDLLPAVGMPSHQGTIRWNNGYGEGIDFEWRCTSTRLVKILEIENLNKLPVPEQYIIDGGNPVLRLNLIFDPSSGVDILVDGEVWDKNSKKQTFNIIEFRKDNDILWGFLPLRYWGSGGGDEDNEGQSIATLEKRGNKLYISIRVPYEWLQDAIYPVFIDTTVDEDVNASANDADERESTGAVNLTWAYVRHRTDVAASFRYWGGHRWTGISIDQLTTIDVCYVQIYIPDAGYDNANINLHFEKATSPGIFTTTPYDITNRPRTDASLSWIEDNVISEPDWVQTGSLVTPLQEVVTAYSITAVALIARPNQDAYKQLDSTSWDNNPDYCAKLHIEYEAVVPPGWTGKISGVTNPAKIMGVDVANIAKVKGVA